MPCLRISAVPSVETNSTGSLRVLASKFDELQTCSSLVYRHGGEFQREVSHRSLYIEEVAMCAVTLAPSYNQGFPQP